MANVVIVTKQCYLLCESIHYVVINEVEDDEPEWSISTSRKSKSRKSKNKKTNTSMKLKNEYIRERKPYQIVINFVPTGQATLLNNGVRSKNNDDTTQVSITVQGLLRAIALFKEMVDQIREQMPDQMFLDKLVEKFLLEQIDDNKD